ncbi:MAG TPA: response regulator [Caulobacteraceae bacterium]|nr:response regulator [Caulobacteraceae bacterium]
MSGSSKASLAGLRVLVVEDEALVSMLLEDMLSDLGCEIVGPIMRLPEALRMAQDEGQPIDVAILDVNLAGERSFPVAEALERRGCLFVLATGYDDGGIEERWRARPLLRKPFLPGQLEEALQAALTGAPA